MKTAVSLFDRVLVALSVRRSRLIGLSLLRIILGIAALIFYVSDFWDRDFLWGPHGYITPHDASAQLHGGLFSIYLWDNSTSWLTAVYIFGMVTATAFTIFGGRALTAAHAVLLWSLYDRNQDILEGGDNFARIAVIFLLFCVSNAYFAPFARRRRERLLAPPTSPRQRAATLLHNVGAALIVFQVAVLYFVAGYLKLTASLWNDGVAMYYVSRIHEFQMFSAYSAVMSNALVSWAVSMFTILFEIAVPFVLFTHRARLRKTVTVALEGMHFGIMVCMGLVAFGLIMIGADCTLLTDKDYRTLARSASGAYRRVRRTSEMPGAVSAPQVQPATMSVTESNGGNTPGCQTTTLSAR
ncbi:HTTM domain-containing protein [Streptomyces sp. 8L]|uniref:HTTM domain-containing protein n=1 Tax=Streptomyces sp. 8L TaxID=2877242 RepID=UPI001CD35B62|nr:HTTM domain-containing protein [Streptomyces sp. 8L]MCA1217900.1 HTTM domain-containing protein [Streptomyces sp. 8L]